MRTRDRPFYVRWIVANGWAESAGLGTTFVIGIGMAPYFDRHVGVTAILAGALLAVVLGTLLEGVLVGIAQERVLRLRLRSLRPRIWTWATAAGAGLAWLVGMVPSTIMALAGEPDSASMVAEPGAVAQLGLAVLLGVVAGPILGVAQWIVLRRFVPRAGRWLWANALAWGVGMPMIFAGMGVVPWSSHAAVIVPAVYGVCAVAGVVVGAIHGAALVQLLPSEADEAGGS
jgi:hypothetical protein